MAVQMPPILKDSTGQSINTTLSGIDTTLGNANTNLAGIITALQALSAPSATNVAVSPTGLHYITEDDAQGALAELDAECFALNNSLTQLPPNITFGTPQVLTWTNDKETFATAGYLTGYVRKSANATAGLFGVTSNKVPSGDYRMIKNFYNASEYQDFNMLVCKGEELTITTKTEILTIHVIFLPFANMS